MKALAGIGVETLRASFYGGDDSGNVTFEGAFATDGTTINLEDHQNILDLVKAVNGGPGEWDEWHLGYVIVETKLGYVPSAGDGYLYGGRVELNLRTGESLLDNQWHEDEDGNEIPREWFTE